MNTSLMPGENLVRESRANLQRGPETVGGHLYLTDRRLIFESHRFNVQRGSTIVPLSDVVAVTPMWTRFLNLIPLLPNSIRIRTRTGEEHRIVCTKRGDWMAAIERAKGAMGESGSGR
jgi:GRAM domain